ncbi:hypothetical protein [Streptomyces sp. NPDC001020]
MHLGLVVAAPADELLVIDQEVAHVIAVLANFFRQCDHTGHLVVVDMEQCLEACLPRLRDLGFTFPE